SARLDAAWQAKLDQRQLYANELFLTVMRRPARGGAGLAEAVSRALGRNFSREQRDAELAAEVRALTAAGDQLIGALAAYQPR
ncbi:hypothetical protein ABTG69_20185, partial [Acinetobacter baumannii]